MAIDAITGTAATGVQSTTPTRAPKQELDSEVFMSLLVAQLTNQDPSSPMDSNQMISQTTQLAMMEKLTELTTTGQEDFSLQMRVAAAALIGHDVTYAGKDGTPVTGRVTAVSYAGGVPEVTVGGVDVLLDLISGITARPAA